MLLQWWNIFYWLLGGLASQHAFLQQTHINTKLTSLYKLTIEYIYVYLWILDAQVQTIQITVLDSDPINYITISVMSHVKLPHKSDTRHDILPRSDLYTYVLSVISICTHIPNVLYIHFPIVPQGTFMALKDVYWVYISF